VAIEENEHLQVMMGFSNVQVARRREVAPRVLQRA